MLNRDLSARSFQSLGRDDMVKGCWSLGLPFPASGSHLPFPRYARSLGRATGNALARQSVVGFASSREMTWLKAVGRLEGMTFTARESAHYFWVGGREPLSFRPKP